MREAKRAPRETDFDGLLRSPDGAPQSVAIVDVGENAEMLTLGALRALRTADIIFFDDDVPSAALDFARREAQRVPVASDSKVVLDRIVEAAKSGARVVRLIAVSAGSVEPSRNDLRRTLRDAGLTVTELPLVRAS
jgi:uroporphyrin-III C-methyltransferase/precorrin-2 dehydrogenase/sirohydrochlorin ferrochelatase